MRPIAVEPKRTRKYTMLRAYNDPMDVEANAGFPSPAAPERWVGERVVWLRRWLPVAIALTVVLHQAWSARAYEGWSSSARFAAGMVFYGIVGPAVTWWTLDWIARSIAAREALTVANHELTQLDALKDEFVRLVSHELRAPLTNINASVELLIGQADDVGQRRKLEIIGHEASRLTRLVQSVLDVSRMQAGRLELLPAPVATAHLCAEAVRRFADADHPCHIEVEPGTAPVLADLDRAVQVLGNLLDNAAKYSRTGSRIDLSAGPLPPMDPPAPDASGGRQVLFSVADRGVGIPAEELPRIFERFHRVERHDARETYGHGLGLYIARMVIEGHGGRIWVQSTPGAGSTFLFTLPAAPEEP